jgi:Raf kinase inhibitor-like YbhB/YbcL family protein
MRTLALAVAAAVAALVPASALAGGFTLASADFGPGSALATAQVYDRTGCHGGNVSPELHWSGAPAATRSFAVTLFDPDVSTGWWHWVLFDIGADTTSLAAGAGAVGHEPAGAVSGRNSFDDIGYSGPCPPPGKPHHYVFRVYALRTEHLGLAAGADGNAVRKALEENAIASASVQGTYGR